jgi:membrane associated rhomboid family serine protease
MGIYDRDYYRREGPSYLESFTVRGQMVKWLLIINITVFVVQLVTRHRDGPVWRSPVDEALVLDSQKVLAGEVWRLLTYAFLHDEANLWHIAINMWVLFMFGGYLEDLYGRWEFLTFYLVAAIVGGIAYVLGGFTPLQLPGRCVGASGAITALMILCAFHYPHLTIFLFFVVPVPLWALAIFQVAQDAFGFLGGSRGGTAFSVHLGGAAFAALYYQTGIRLLGLLPNLRSWRQQRSRARLRVFRPDEESREPVAVTTPSAPDVDEQLEAKVDAVLEKVARFGQSSLTEQEREILLKASEIYKRRRT